MTMNDFNKSNPFVIIMRDRYNEFTMSAVKTLKSLVIEFIILFLGLTYIILFEKYKLIFTASISILVISYFLNLFFLYKAIKNSETAQIDDMIYGNKYSIINVNNEQIFDIIQKINYNKGKIDYLYETTIVDIVITVLIIAISILV